MYTAYDASVATVAYLALFSSVGILFLFVNLLVGKLVRPANPFPEKLEIYECGEPSIGSSFVQFDLRFYVVALLFIIFDVEVAFFFPWAVVFGKATTLASASDSQVVQVVEGRAQLTRDATLLQREMGIRAPQLPTVDSVPEALRASGDAVLGAGASAEAQGAYYVKHTADLLAWTSLVDIAVFFAVLLMGFAYVWYRGDLDWVRSVSKERGASQAAARAARSPALAS